MKLSTQVQADSFNLINLFSPPVYKGHNITKAYQNQNKLLPDKCNFLFFFLEREITHFKTRFENSGLRSEELYCLQKLDKYNGLLSHTNSKD